MTAITMRRAVGRGALAPRRTMLVGIGLPLLAVHVIGPWADAVMPGAFGIAFLASLATSRPLLARLAARRAAGKPAVAASLAAPRAVRALRLLTAVWGVALSALAVVLLALAANLPASAFGPIGTALGLAVPGVLGAATFAYVRRRSSDPAGV